jgi:FAD/FMN-containing dehydrogenase
VLPVVSNTLLPRVDASAAVTISDAYQAGGAGRVIFLRSLGGAVSRVPADETAFGHRDIEAMAVTAAFLPLDASPEMITAAARPADAIAAHGVGAYAGFLGSESPDDVKRIYPAETLARLTEVKRAYDPDNVFRHNFNIAPR